MSCRLDGPFAVEQKGGQRQNRKQKTRRVQAARIVAEQGRTGASGKFDGVNTLGQEQFFQRREGVRHGQTRMPYTNAPRYVRDDAALKQGQRLSLMPVGLNSLPRLRRLLCRQRPFLDAPPDLRRGWPFAFCYRPGSATP